jgi:hypothetical protein
MTEKQEKAQKPTFEEIIANYSISNLKNIQKIFSVLRDQLEIHIAEKDSCITEINKHAFEKINLSKKEIQNIFVKFEKYFFYQQLNYHAKNGDALAKELLAEHKVDLAWESLIYYFLFWNKNILNDLNKFINQLNEHLKFNKAKTTSQNTTRHSNKINLIISKNDGIYQYNNKALNYGISGKRSKIIYWLKDGKKDGNLLSENLYGEKKLPLLSGEIIRINSLFKEKLNLDFDLICNANTGGYFLNTDNYELEFE